MKPQSAIKILSILLLFLLISACNTPETNTNQAPDADKTQNSNLQTTKDNTEEFEKIAKFEAVPEEVIWREIEEKKIIAVLRFSTPDVQKIVSQVGKQNPPQNAVINSEDWFPPELIAKSQQSGDETLKGKTYPANEFVLSPYNKAKITQIDETNYFILEIVGN